MDAQKCVGCGGCVNICPATAISFVEDVARIDKDLCDRCGLCSQICGVEAMEAVE